MTDYQSLISLGLNAYEAAAYVALLGRPELSSSEVATLANVPRQRIYDILASLIAKGLCIARETTPKTYFACSPETALDLLAGERVAALERQQRDIEATAARAAAELLPIFAAGRGQTDPLAYVGVLSGTTRIAQQALALAQAAKISVKSCIKRPMILSKEQNWTFLKAPLGRGLTYRALCDADLLDDAELLDWMNQFRDWGLAIRVVPELPLKMQAFDEETVLISMQDPTAGQPSFTAITVHNRGLVAMLNLAFEHLWDAALPFEDYVKNKTGTN
ncbi:helix-turn-helix domain-containing protein [Telmatospirillum sp.]|uniref:TrmB family transcriptional regulator n=1 Tax=Telmatospirillum sp. TaxID=2079197 RepID=UPI00284E4C77|nr:helix-turn-helix domain-containing protein [Telmatospirillum sp.]MDR3438027.1 helix-turn-helix domain-containing protein [Telmatospirillum sp.]